MYLGQTHKYLKFGNKAGVMSKLIFCLILVRINNTLCALHNYEDIHLIEVEIKNSKTAFFNPFSNQLWSTTRVSY